MIPIPNAVHVILMLTLLHAGVPGATAAEPDRKEFVATASSYVDVDKMILGHVGISPAHPRHQAFRKGFDAMFADPVVLGALYDALKERNLLAATPSADTTAAMVDIWSVMLKQGIPRLEIEDQRALLAIRLGFFRSIPAEQCGRILKGAPGDGAQFYAWLAGRPEKTIRDFLHITTEAVRREAMGTIPRETATEEQAFVSAAVLGREITRRYGEPMVKLVARVVDGDTSVTDRDHCAATRIIWREALNLRGDPRRWIVRGMLN